MSQDELSLQASDEKNDETPEVTQSAEEGSTMGRVLPGNTVSIHYTGRLEDGTVFFSTENKEPFIFTHGKGAVVPRVQQAVLGMAQGESKSVHVPEEEAYGAYNPELAVKMDRAEFEKRGIKPEIGFEFSIGQSDGDPLPVRVTEVEDSTVTVDANHPLAGNSIIFDLLLVAILPNPVTEN
jgi:FKBP-type peptidyl-prolyl cis-trans isomerase 2